MTLILTITLTQITKVTLTVTLSLTQKFGDITTLPHKFDFIPDCHLDPKHEVDLDLDLDTYHKVDLDRDHDLDPERSGMRAELVKTTCKLVWPSVWYRKTWTYTALVVGLFVPLVAIAIFNMLLIYRMRTLNRNKQKAGVQRMRRLTDVARMVLVVVVIFAVCQLPYHVMEIISVQVHVRVLIRCFSPEIMSIFSPV